MERFTKEEQEKFSTLLTELKKWNEHTNLTAIRDDESIIKKHFLDSLSVIEAIPPLAKNIIDVGTGAGFPGLPIAFLNHIVNLLKLTNVKVICERAEDTGHVESYREKYDVAVSRGVASLPTLLEYCLPFVKIDGVFIAQKMSGSDELKQSENALNILGGAFSKTISIKDDSGVQKELIIIEKKKTTEDKYPRRKGLPSKKPIY